MKSVDIILYWHEAKDFFFNYWEKIKNILIIYIKKKLKKSNKKKSFYEMMLILLFLSSK